MARGRAPYTKPTILRQLCREVGDNQRVADKVGVGYSTLSKYLSTDACPVPVEKSAELAMLQRRGGVETRLPALRHEIIFVKCPPEHLDMIMNLCKTVGCKVTRWKDE